MWKLSSPCERAVHELSEKIDEARMRADNSNWDTPERSGGGFSTITFRERLQTNPPVQVPSLNMFGTSYSNFDKS